MKERPIIFNAEMVKAILDGRKTQTRRIIKPQPTLSNTSGFNWKGAAYGLGFNDKETNRNFANTNACPLGKVGDRLWVRETWWQAGYGARPYPESDEYEWVGSKRAHYAVDGNPPNEPNSDYPSGLKNGSFSAANPNRVWRKRPSIHMPRWASRITLEITEVRVERLNAISENDALSEGCVALEGCKWHTFKEAKAGTPMHDHTAKDAFSAIWQSIYGEESWSSNPWVWVIEFKRVEGGAV